MRQYIQDLKMGAQFVWAGKQVEECDCGITGELIHAPHLQLAIDDYAKSIEMQILDDQIDKTRVYKITSTKGSDVGKVNGLVVVGGSTGDVITVTAWIRKVKEHERADFVVTGMPTEADTWMQNSVRTVRTTIYRLYGIDIGKDYYTHVSFLQSDPKSVDGPSAGITMTLAIMSWLGDPRIPEADRAPVLIRQDTAITGTVENMGMDGEQDTKVGPIGGVFEKVYGASKWGATRVIIPMENYNHNWFESPLFKKVKVHGASSVLQYFDMLRTALND